MAKRILVIDDAAAIRQVVELALQSREYKVVQASDGEEGLRQMKETRIDLVICDVNMPKVDGIEFLRSLKQDAAYASCRFTPVIMLTTEAGEAMKEKGKDLGAKVWLIKPFKPEQLLNAVDKLTI